MAGFPKKHSAPLGLKKIGTEVLLPTFCPAGAEFKTFCTGGVDTNNGQITQNDCDSMALTISIISLIISLLTFWLTKIWKGSLKMTRPSMICLVPQNGGGKPKVFLRTLLYGTSDQGQYIENMFIKLHNGEIIQNFNEWYYGDTDWVRGSGLFASKEGVSINHHFYLPENENWGITSGDFNLELFAQTGDSLPKKVFEQQLFLSTEQSNDLQLGKAIYYNWIPNTGQYLSQTVQQPPINQPSK